MTKFSTFLFDWDGCLADTTSVWLEPYFKALKKRGVNVTFQQLRQQAWGNHEKGPKNLGVIDYQECWNEIVFESEELLKKVALFKGASLLLKKLKKSDKKIALVTSSYKNVVTSAIKYHKIANCFDILLTKEDVQNVKPDPEVINKAIGFLTIKKEETIMVGDTESDVLAGKAAGVKTALILHSSNSQFHDIEKLKETKPDFVFSSFKELFEQLV